MLQAASDIGTTLPLILRQYHLKYWRNINFNIGTILLNYITFTIGTILLNYITFNIGTISP